LAQIVRLFFVQNVGTKDNKANVLVTIETSGAKSTSKERSTGLPRDAEREVGLLTAGDKGLTVEAMETKGDEGTSTEAVTARESDGKTKGEESTPGQNWIPCKEGIWTGISYEIIKIKQETIE
jgi:hypothetical protein